ncbi:hypothetical protein RclHR1_05850008 [Rhizophagus clarus]|uniref:F-box domain-containing protein n=1 Tax=Rhizophagus clarus TaxID=94130 RepID=A0A2Z6SH36_9GLOM|nr:hypothetical protein RclHR1_05850008 [Rhizophagus clarus]GES74689.1 hypothetical protein GLOIN_2v1777674 [Rhizophagus clarus]
MAKLNRDILYLIFKELSHGNNSLRSYTLVNKTWCEVVIPILWKNPWKYLTKERETLLFNVIISYLSDETKNNLKNQGMDYLENSYQTPLFDYFKFCRYLKLDEIVKLITKKTPSEIYISIKNEILNIFINENRKYTHLYIPYEFNDRIHLIPGAEHCLSEIEFLSCNVGIDDEDIIIGLTEICKSIKGLELIIIRNINYGVIRLIEAPKKLNEVHFINHCIRDDESFCHIYLNSLIKHANTIQYFKIIDQTAITLSTFVNLKVLELVSEYKSDWYTLENWSLPFLQVLRTSFVPVKPLASLIENTSKSLIEINIDNIYNDKDDNKRIIQAIHKNCPNLIFLKVLFRNCSSSELEKLLTNCQYLKVLYIITCEKFFNWDNLFEILMKSSPIGLFRFRFRIFTIVPLPKSESLKLFFDKWKGKRPMLLNFNNMKNAESSLINKYEAEGLVKHYNNLRGDFDWESP